MDRWIWSAVWAALALSLGGSSGWRRGAARALPRRVLSAYSGSRFWCARAGRLVATPLFAVVAIELTAVPLRARSFVLAGLADGVDRDLALRQRARADAASDRVQRVADA